MFFLLFTNIEIKLHHLAQVLKFIVNVLKLTQVIF